MKIPPLQKDIRVSVSTPLKRSEDPRKVRSAMENVLGTHLDLSDRSGYLRFTGLGEKYLYPLYESLRKRRTLSVAKRLLLHNQEEGKTHLLLNKQAAFVGTLVLCEGVDESPLGPIQLTIETKELESVITWLSGEE